MIERMRTGGSTYYKRNEAMEEAGIRKKDLST
jgi:hypothetical protein